MKKTQTLLTLLIAVMLTGAAMGDTGYWNGASGTDVNWMTTNNWINGLRPTSADNANFRARTGGAENARGELTNAVTIVNLLTGGNGALSTQGIPALTLKPGSELTLTGIAHIGYSLIQDKVEAIGELNIEAGTHTIANTLNIGNAAGTSTNDATGTLTIGNATLNVNNTTKIGTAGASAPASSTGTLLINQGATVNMTAGGAHTLYVGDYGTGNLTMNGGTLNFIGETKQTFAGYRAGSTGTIEFNSGSINGAHSITIGKTGTGNLVVNGGMLSFDPLKTLLVATDAGSTGTVEVVDGVLNLGKEPTFGAGEGIVDVQGGFLMISDGAWRKAAIEAQINAGQITATGGGSSVADDAAYTALYTAGTGSTNLTEFITLKWGITSSEPRTNAVWAVDSTLPPDPTDPYDAWMAPHTNTLSEAEQAKDADPDDDDMDNLLEYALGGNPTTNDAAAIQPTSSLVGNELEYLYNRRTNHVALGISYYLELTPSLVNTAFTNDVSAYTEIGASDPTGEFETVTNRVGTAADSAKFITLTIEN
ncbi:hypothetical protein [Pontiella sulfatireligans]|uniref:Autotransporter domain-containing protein n=1 Tax=Pontiella sulfatireligans TaxID=2750658 RepID=A0A6C2UDY5_9BACT|nr:hypothetical protein [Pontiella sulfatireligans]VGO18355.1 hypothetical protein SCARR_00407 [Pontiella sulfatireligans]